MPARGKESASPLDVAVAKRLFEPLMGQLGLRLRNEACRARVEGLRRSSAMVGVECENVVVSERAPRFKATFVEPQTEATPP